MSLYFLFTKNIMIYRSIITLFAGYASFKYNDGFDLKQFLLAMFFQEMYIVYILAVDRHCLIE